MDNPPSKTFDARAAAFEACRRDLVALAYRMLGDVARAEDMVQDAWVRFQAHDGEVESPRAFLVTVVTRLCLNELASARARHEESRADRLPEPVDLAELGMDDVERLDEVSMAFLVLLQRLTPAERAVFLLHEVFELEHREIARLVGNNAAACRKLLERARSHVASGKRMLLASEDEHRRLLEAFIEAARSGDVQRLVAHLADDAVLVTDGGPGGRELFGARNAPRPLHGAARIAAFIAVTALRAPSRVVVEEHELNGRPAVVFRDGDRPFAAMLLAVADGKIQRVFFHANPARLGRLGNAKARAS